ncbi:MAG: hypothetical protein ANIMEMIM_00131 [Candidatus Argoarchaeum ethanivorans]|uniref:DUF7490 domain-containing protein n=1 Tax=Candidatus Argoarchaeum ethanivorans TaxID=2608793 RepID=A0A811T7L5_9EURY|nr:MAG: hypothetical protein ANIMEMIM_00131 [Candidatus Argoarchaeum ethanivorans]
MDRDLSTILIVVVLFLIFVGLLAALGGDEKEKSRFWIRNIDIKAEAVDEDTVNITAIITLEHRGDATGGVKLLAKVYDGKTGLLLSEQGVPVGGLESRSAMNNQSVVPGGEQSVETRLSFMLPTKESLRLVVELFEGDEFIADRKAIISGLSTLKIEDDPEIQIRDVDFAVNRTNGDRMIVDATAYIDNLKSADTTSLRMLIKVEDSETGLLVDLAEVDIGSLAGGGTSIRSASLSLLGERDHAVDLTIWNGDKIIAEGYGEVGLSPFGNRTEFIPVTGTVIEKEPEISVDKFIPPRPAPTPSEEAIHYKGVGGMGSPELPAPGFGVIGTVFALSIALLLRRTRKW